MEDKLDRLLEGALREYANVPPPPGLTAGIHRRIRRAETNRTLGATAGAIAAIAAVALLLVSHFAPRPTVRPVELATQSARLVLPATLSVPPLPISPIARPSRRLVRTTKRPKLDRFPYSAPLTGEERILLAMVCRYPDRTTQALAQINDQMERPTRIEPITILPMERPSASGEIQ